MLGSGLVVAQVAVSFFLLIGAGLMLRSFIKLMEVNPGFRTDHLLSMRLLLLISRNKNPSRIPTLMDSIMRHVNAIHGVEMATLVSNVPLSPNDITGGPGSTNFLFTAGRPYQANWR
jgi:putative ABC transport system permease protein